MTEILPNNLEAQPKVIKWGHLIAMNPTLQNLGKYLFHIVNLYRQVPTYLLYQVT